jgi:hypothetical protein
VILVLIEEGSMAYIVRDAAAFAVLVSFVAVLGFWSEIAGSLV